MTIPFIGGPYDGLVMSALEIQRIAVLTSINTKRGLRKFATFPDPNDMFTALTGKNVDGRKPMHRIYELVNTITGPQHQYDVGGKRYREALAESI